MAKKVYVGYGGLAHNVSKIYVGKTMTYIPVEYLQTNGYRYFDTLYSPNSNTKIEIKLSFDSASRQECLFWGRDYDQSMVASNNFNILKFNGTFRFDYDTNGTSFSHTVSANTPYIYIADKNELYENGTLINTATSSTFNTTKSLLLLASYHPNWVYADGDIGTGNYVLGKLYYCKIWDNDTLVRDFISVVDNEGVGCLFDLVSNKPFYSLGTVSGLTAGQEIQGDTHTLNLARSVSKAYVGVSGTAQTFYNKIQYTPVNYIESTGTQCINTGIRPRANICTEIKFRYTHIYTNKVQQLAGVYNNASPYRYYTLTQTYKSGVSIFVTFTGGSSSTQVQSPADTNWHIIKYNDENHKILFDGVSKATSPSSWSINNVRPLPLFCRQDGDWSPKEYSEVQIEYCKIWDTRTNQMLRDFIPVLDGNNVACLFDKVSKTFFYNRGTGDFLYG